MKKKTFIIFVVILFLVAMVSCYLGHRLWGHDVWLTCSPLWCEDTSWLIWNRF